MIKETWEERVSMNTAHLKMDENKKAYLESSIKDLVVKDKRIVDYGCACGYLGQLVLDRGCQWYYGIDVSQRAIQFARDYLKGYQNKTLIVSEVLKEGDVFICLNVVQHFPTEQYFKDWIMRVNDMGYEKILLNYREGPVSFREKLYETMEDVLFANTMNSEYVITYMTNYKVYDIIQTGKFTILGFK